MDLESIQKTARSDLLLPTIDGSADVFLWEHSLRVARSAQHIARLPEARSLGADELSVFVAGLYHDAGWASRVKSGELDRMQVLLGPTVENDFETGALMLEQSLRGRVSPTVLQRAAVAVRTRQDRSSRSADAVVLAEAEALDEFGVLPLWLTVRRGAREGRGVEAAIESWVRKKEYRFWAARLTDSSHLSNALGSRVRIYSVMRSAPEPKMIPTSNGLGMRHQVLSTLTSQNRSRCHCGSSQYSGSSLLCKCSMIEGIVIPAATLAVVRSGLFLNDRVSLSVP